MRNMIMLASPVFGIFGVLCSIELACALYGNSSDTVDLWSMIRAPRTLYGNSSLLNVWHMIGQQAYLSMSTRVVHYFIFFVNFIILLSSACFFP